jgi:hypothetical protein
MARSALHNVARTARIGVIGTAMALSLLLWMERTARACDAVNVTWWAQNGGTIQMWPAADNFCFLTRISGLFDGSKGTNVGVSVEMRSDGYWWLITQTGNEYAEGHCAPKSCFSGASPNASIWWSSPSSLSLINDTNGSGCDYQQSSGAWWGDAVTMVQAWPNGPGATESGHDHVNVAQSSDAFTSSVVSSNKCSDDDGSYWYQPFFSSLFVGTPSSGIPVQLASTGYTRNNYKIDLLASPNDAMCYLQFVQGKFHGGGENVQIFIQNGEWFAQTSVGSGGDAIGANYACVFFHQNH